MIRFGRALLFVVSCVATAFVVVILLIVKGKGPDQYEPAEQ